jgi:hypothetical protein
VSILQILRDHRPRAFSLSLTRGDSRCHACEFHLPSHSVLMRPSGAYCNPVKDLLDAVINLSLRGRDAFDARRSRTASFEWDCEPAVFTWKLRHLRRVAGIRLIISYRCEESDPSFQVVMDAVVEERELFRQIWENTRTLLVEGGVACLDARSPFPFREFLRVHELFTGEPQPRNLSEEIALLTRLSVNSPN